MVYQIILYAIVGRSIVKLNSFLLLFDRVNVSVGEKEDRMMMTGLHTVADIFCVGCGSIVGWKYVRINGITFLAFYGNVFFPSCF